MRYLAILAAVLLGAPAFAQTPTYSTITLTQSATSPTIKITGASNLLGGGQMLGTFTGPTLFSNVLPTITTYTVATLPVAAAGTMAFASDCRNGSEGSGAGTGCFEIYKNGSWVALASPPNQPITIGGQSVYLGGSTVNTGTGSAVQTSNATSPVSGHVPQYDSTGALIDSGSGPGGGGGSGSVSSCATGNSPAIYASSGTTASCIAGANSSILVSGSGGTLSMSTTAPTGLTLPSPAITGTGTYAALTGSGKLTTAATAVGGANFNLPQGTAPSAPANGDVWMTSAGGLYYQHNSATVGPVIGLAQLSGTSPIVDTSGAFSCPTCATTTSGGALTATAPMTISSAGLIALGETTTGVPFLFNATTTVTNDSYEFYWPWATGHVTSVKYYTGGSGTPAFSVAVSVNGSVVTGCSAISVTASNTQASPGTTTCTSTAITQYQPIKMAISGVTGTPFSSLVEVLGTKSAL
jgi:hypothetical protein